MVFFFHVCLDAFPKCGFINYLLFFALPHRRVEADFSLLPPPCPTEVEGRGREDDRRYLNFFGFILKPEALTGGVTHTR